MDNNTINNLHKISIAPMMDCTDKHYRMMMRKITSEALLYTEMIVAQSLLYTKNKEKFLNFNKEEHPVAIQFGGDNPLFLKEVAKIAQDWGYDEINFNVGCPSPRVSSGNFGASLMNYPKKVSRCIEALKNNCNLPITVKHRIGVDENDSLKNLNDFVRETSCAGAERFIVHARKAILKGLNPKENRTIPPLRYDMVQKLKENNPNLIIEINGGFLDIEQCEQALHLFDGVMVGRNAYRYPLRWQNIDNKFYEKNFSEKKASGVISSLIPYFEKHLENNGASWDICKHLINLVVNIPMAKKWRKEISIKSIAGKLTPEDLYSSANKLKDIGY